MCGIAGILSAPGSTSGPDSSARFGRRSRAMAQALRHRGPDAEGFFDDPGKGAQVHLAHRRLSILDPSPLGAQPMTDPSGRYTLVFNGAIYNFVELREELRRLPGAVPFRGGSDTEVLLRAFAAFGPACLPRLNGMFAFALWDAAERTLYLCRDRFGVKPLHYAWLGEAKDGTRLLFASEAKALFVHPALRPVPDRRALAEFLLSRDIDHYEEGTAYEGISQVPRASCLTIAPGSPPRLSRYWQLQPVPDGERLPLSDELVRTTRDLLIDAVRVRLRSDVPLGGTLSGGLDSSLLTGIVAGPLYREGKVAAPYRIFLSQFPGSKEGHKGDESPWAEQMLASLPGGVALPLRSSPGKGELSDDLENVLYHQEEPFADSSICAHYALMRVVQKSGVKVVLTGQGADEIFGGYISYYYTMLGDLLRRGRPLSMLREARARARVFGEPLGRLLAGGAYHAAPAALRQRLHHLRLGQQYPLSAEGKRLCAQAEARYGGGEATAGSGGWPLLDGYLLDCIRRWALPHILRQDDRNAMAFGIESRAPYLDYRLAELVFRTEPTVRLSQGYTKLLLREAGKGLMPDQVRLRPDKMGFWSPQREWLLSSESLVREVAENPPGEVGALTETAPWQAGLGAFYRDGDYRLTEQIWTGFLCSLWVKRTLLRMQAIVVS